MSTSTTIPKGSSVLVTGANGYLGMHVADQLLADGYKVKGTVRDSEKAQWTKEYFDGKYGAGNFEAHIVEDALKEGAFDELLKGSSGIIHVASDVSFGEDPNKVVTPVVNGITSLLHSAALQPSIKSFVLTSSSAAISHGRMNEKFVINKTLWNHKAVEAAWAPPPYTAERGAVVYAASKMQGEEKAWELLKHSDAKGLKFNSINPNWLVGKFLHPKQNKSTGGMVLGLRYGDARAIGMVKLFGPQWMVDVVDVARLHVIALVDPEVSGERILGFTEKISYNILVDKIGQVAGADAVKDLAKIDQGVEDLSEVDVKRSEELLRSVGLPGFKGLDQSLKELLESAA